MNFENFVLSEIESKKIKYVSFDLFDTLVFRKINKPADIFHLVEYHYEREFGRINSFSKDRKTAESEARSKSSKEDVSIDDIYNYLPYSYDDIKVYKELEKQAEINTVIENKEVISVLNKLKQKGIKIIIVTDMYLDRQTIAGILKKCHIDYNSLYISGEIGLSKATGKLYDYVITIEKILPKEFLHIGDNYESDVINARNHGLHSIYYKEQKRSLWYFDEKCKSSNILENVFYNSLFRGIQYENKETIRLGYEIIGPFIYKFLSWVHSEKIANNLETLWFVSREGWLLYKAYKVLYPTEDVKYVCLNKNILRFPYIAIDFTLERLVRTLPSKNTITCGDLFHYLCIEESEIKKIMGDSIDVSKEINLKALNLENQELINRLVTFKKKNILEQKELFKHYLKSLGSNKRIGLVNNSIYGNGQLMLEDFLLNEPNCDTKIFGLQFIKGKRYPKISCDSWNEFNPFGIKNYIIFKRTALPFEHLLFESVGTAINLYEQNGEIKVRTEKQLKENENIETVKEIQEGILRFIEDSITFEDDYTSFTIEKGFFKFLENPTYEAAYTVGNLYDDEGVNSARLVEKTNIGRKSIIMGQKWKTSKFTGAFFSIHKIPLFIVKLYYFIIVLRNLFKYPIYLNRKEKRGGGY